MNSIYASYLTERFTLELVLFIGAVATAIIASVL